MAKLGPRKEQIDAQRATVQQLEGALSLAMVDLDNTVIRAPISATVLERNVEVGEFVTTGFVGERGAKGYVVSIADLNDLRVELDISQSDFAKVSLKQPCSITTDAYPDKKYDGVVDLISPEANRTKATVEVRVKVLNPDALLKPVKVPPSPSPSAPMTATDANMSPVLVATLAHTRGTLASRCARPSSSVSCSFYASPASWARRASPGGACWRRRSCASDNPSVTGVPGGMRAGLRATWSAHALMSGSAVIMRSPIAEQVRPCG